MALYTCESCSFTTDSRFKIKDHAAALEHFSWAGDEDVFIVIRATSSEVGPIRRLLMQHFKNHTSAVFRKRPSLHNFGVDLYPWIKPGMDEIRAKVKNFRAEQERDNG